MLCPSSWLDNRFLETVNVFISHKHRFCYMILYYASASSKPDKSPPSYSSPTFFCRLLPLFLPRSRHTTKGLALAKHFSSQDDHVREHDIEC